MKEILVHDETNRILAMQLAGMEPPDFPVALGVLYCDPRESYNDSVHGQIEAAKQEPGPDDLDAVLREGQTWVVEG